MLKYFLIIALTLLTVKSAVVGEMTVLGRTATQAVTSSTALVDDNTLTLPVTASHNYGFEYFVPFNLAGIASGYKFAINGPSSPTSVVYTIQVYNLTTGVSVLIGRGGAFDSVVAGSLATIGDHVAVIRGTLRNGVNSGNMVLRFAQNVSDIGAITVAADASVKIWNLN